MRQHFHHQAWIYPVTYSLLHLTIFLLTSIGVGLAEDVPLSGPPRNPELLSIVAGIWQSGTNGHYPAPKGPVRQVTWEKSQMTVGQPGKGVSLEQRTVVEYDSDQHEIQRTDELLNQGGACTTKNTWLNGRIATQEHRCVGKRGITNAWWRKWTYDSAGRVTEYHEHSNVSEPRYLYHYDTKGRMLGWDFKQWGDDLFDRVGITHTGNVVDTATYDNSGRKVALQVQVLDDAGRVIDLKASEVRDGTMALWYHTAFKYDDRGRTVEQQTDPYTVGVGADNAPLPGRLVVHYNDPDNTVELFAYDTAGNLDSHELAQLDKDGVAVSFRHFDRDGKPETGSEFVINDKTGQAENRKGEIAWRVTYDDRGNWIERQSWFTPADGSPRALLRILRQTIVYR